MQIIRTIDPAKTVTKFILPRWISIPAAIYLGALAATSLFPWAVFLLQLILKS